MLSVARLYFVAALGILVTAAGGVAGWWLAEHAGGGGQGPTDSEAEVLQSTAMAYAALERERFRRLQTEALALADGSAVVEFVANVAETDEVAPTTDSSDVDLQLRQAGVDFVAILDAAGQVLVSNDPGAGAPPAGSVAGAGPTQELWNRGDQLLLMVTVPIAPLLGPPDAPLSGQVVVGEGLDGFLAREIEQISGGEVAFVVRQDGELTVAATSLDNPAAWASALDSAEGSGLVSRALGQGGMVDGGPVNVAGESRRLRAIALGEPAGGVLLVAAPVAVPSASWWPLAGLAGSALLSLLLVLPLAWLLRTRGDRETSPGLGEWVQQVRRGEATMSQPPEGVAREPDSSSARLVHSLQDLLTDVEQERALNGLLAAARAEETGGQAQPEDPRRGPVTLLAAELRRHARASDPDQALVDLTADLAILLAASEPRGGHLEALAGHRVLLAFPGEEGVRRALAAAVEIVEVMGDGGAGGADAEPPPLALATGRLVTGRVETPDGPRTVCLGLPSQLVETVLREATAGQIFFSRDIHRAWVEGPEEVGPLSAPQQGILTTQPLYGLTPEQARQLLGDRESPGNVPTQGDGLLRSGSIFAERFEVRHREADGPLAWNYRALDRELDREVLLKVFRPGALGEEERMSALDTPLQPYRSFQHSHAARLYDFGTLEQRPFLTRRWVAGLHLGRLLQRLGRPAPLAALAASRQLAAVLAAAHGEGLVHLRLKPTNVLFDLDGNGVQVTDFGLTEVGAGPGAAGWGAPEQADGQPGDARSDVYTCGLLIHRLFVGTAAEKAPPSAVTEILNRCRAEDPADRFQHAGELRQALEAVRL